MENNETVFCPLVDSKIEPVDCIENCDCISGLIKLECLPEEYKAKPNFMSICKSCKYHNL